MATNKSSILLLPLEFLLLSPLVPLALPFPRHLALLPEGGPPEAGEGGTEGGGGGHLLLGHPVRLGDRQPGEHVLLVHGLLPLLLDVLHLLRVLFVAYFLRRVEHLLLQLPHHRVRQRALLPPRLHLGHLFLLRLGLLEVLGHVLGRHVLLGGLCLVGLLLLLLPGVPELARQQAGVRLELRRVVRAFLSCFSHPDMLVNLELELVLYRPHLLHDCPEVAEPLHGRVPLYTLPPRPPEEDVGQVG